VGTTREVSEALDMDLQSLTPRARPLIRKGFVAETGKKKNGSRVLRLTESGQQQIQGAL
jgi:DNA-binding MarR family transcriptional regulator